MIAFTAHNFPGTWVSGPPLQGSEKTHGSAAPEAIQLYYVGRSMESEFQTCRLNGISEAQTSTATASQ